MATQYGGYMGKILQIDLTTEIATEYSLPISSAEKRWSGKPLAYHILSKELTDR